MGLDDTWMSMMINADGADKPMTTKIVRVIPLGSQMTNQKKPRQNNNTYRHSTMYPTAESNYKGRFSDSIPCPSTLFLLWWFSEFFVCRGPLNKEWSDRFGHHLQRIPIEGLHGL